MVWSSWKEWKRLLGLVNVKPKDWGSRFPRGKPRKTLNDAISNK